MVMSKYIPTIGLEIHAELKTKTKMFCDCLNDPTETRPNVNVCPVCLGHPGTLPVMNKKAIESLIMAGMALHGDIPQVSKFDRKNYFYPDLPKGYQISQYDIPLVFGGILNGIRLTRIHLEEDTGRLVHGSDAKHSLVDFNRAGVPLMELVTEPDVKNAEEAVQFARELQLILRYLGISDADMEKGQMRVEANVSVRPATTSKEVILGTKVEVKNINSFKAVHSAIEYEIKRQTKVIEDGEKVVQETRGWDVNKQKTVAQRRKEEAHDYRYFPEPDLPPLDLSLFKFSELKAAIPELPQEKRVRFAKEYNLSPEKIEVLISGRRIAEFFEEAISELKTEDNEHLPKEIDLLANYLNSDLRGCMINAGIGFNELKITPENFADLIELISHNKVSSRGAKDILMKMFETGLDPRAILEEGDMGQISDESALTETIKVVLEKNSDAVADYKKGKINALKFLVGQSMALLKGKGNPTVLQELIRKQIES
jgi:aspartyl-tRNA(Asn)/glutamyl-tRNA(Gln) amidotransferase subunit B